MKTSNKLLIALAVALVVIPILVVAINVKLNYKSASKWSENLTSLHDFETESSGFKKEKITQNFNEINFVGQKGLMLNLTLIKSSSKGIKLSDGESSAIKSRVDANGVLQISFNEQKNSNFKSVTLAIYGPEVNRLKINDLLQLRLTAKADDLNLDVSNLQSMAVDVNSRINKLTVSGNQLKNFSIDREIASELNLNLINSEFKTAWASYKKLSINASGASSVNITGDDQDRNKYKIDELVLNSTGSPFISISRIHVSQSSVNLSDSTVVSMPAQYLKNKN